MPTGRPTDANEYQRDVYGSLFSSSDTFPTVDIDGPDGPGGMGEGGDPSSMRTWAKLGRSFYERINNEVGKSRTVFPTSQAQRAAVASRNSMFIQPRNAPSASQRVEGFTRPMQTFTSTNTWQTPMGQNSKGMRASQPSYTWPDLSARNQIRTRMPWDV